MSTSPAQDPTTAAGVAPTTLPQRGARPQRVLACVLCQQRKVKCDREFPCANCIRVGVECVQATVQPRQRRRKVTERALLARVHHYEDLLRHNKIDFKPLASIEKPSASEDNQARDAPDQDQSGSDVLMSGRLSTEPSGRGSHHREPTDLEDDDDSEEEDVGSAFLREIVRDAMFVNVWDKLSEGNDHLLFGPRRNLELSTFHPGQVQIFKLWQIYLDNVNPLLKVTHTPTLQPRIIDAASDVTNIAPHFEALMFSIYCMAILSIEEDECRATFNASRAQLLGTYRFGCQQALLNCGFLRTSDHDCLTAFFLYIISVRPSTDPRAVSSILGMAVRIAQRLGIDRETNNGKKDAFEAEMDRRLWWALSLFDSRVCEMAGFRSPALSPSWPCRLPVNVNDFDLQPGMKSEPTAHDGATDAVFAVVRSELGNCHYQQRAFQLDLRSLPTPTEGKSSSSSSSIPGMTAIDELENKLESKYLSSCNPEIPLHFMTIWTARGTLARLRLEEYYTKYSRLRNDQAQQPTDLLRDAAISWALTMLICDTKVSTSPLTKAYVWLLNVQFPFFAYLHLCQELVRRPFVTSSARIWETMSNNYETRFERFDGFTDEEGGGGSRLGSYFEQKEGEEAAFRIWSYAILSAWQVHEKAMGEAGMPVNPPSMVPRIRNVLANLTANGGGESLQSKQQNLPGGGPHRDPLYGGTETIDPANLLRTMGRTSGGFGQPPLEEQVYQFNWDAVDWSMMNN